LIVFHAYRNFLFSPSLLNLFIEKQAAFIPLWLEPIDLPRPFFYLLLFFGFAVEPLSEQENRPGAEWFRACCFSDECRHGCRQGLNNQCGASATPVHFSHYRKHRPRCFTG